MIKNRIIKYSTLFFTSLSCFASPGIDDLDLTISMRQYEPEFYNSIAAHKTFDSDNNTIHFQGSVWKSKMEKFPSSDGTFIDINYSLECIEGELKDGAVAIDINIDDWNNNVHVMAPSALYNGNKYEWRRIRYSPKLMDPRDIGPDVGIILSDVPRLNYTDGPSRVQFRSGDMATPSVNYWNPTTKQGFIMLTTQKSDFGDNGIYIEENNDRSKAVFTVAAPVIREKYKYKSTDNSYPAEDVAPTFKVGDIVHFKLQIHSFESENVQGLYDYYARVRKNLAGKTPYNNFLPFSEAFRIQEKKFMSENWVDVKDDGYFSVGAREFFLTDWQIGWTGGMISTLPLLFSGDEKTKENVIKNFNWVFNDGISPSGFFWDSGADGDKWYGGDIRKFHTKNWHLTRKSGDGLFFILEQFDLMEKKGITVKEDWKAKTKGVADAFVRLWEENHQIGQFINNETGEIIVGGSTSGAIVPAALVLASEYYNVPKYAAIAEEIGQYYYDNYTSKGLACGGMGDALQNFDSESGYAIIEAYYHLYEASGKAQWLQAAEEAARQFSTWVISYNYEFPKNSTYGKLNIESVGAVFANTQNKHGSPGICTHSGIAFLKLFRATGDPLYAELLNDIVHAIPQCLSHPVRGLPNAHDGWINERISTTDWNEGIGEIMYNTTWAETTLMLTYSQIPGLYIMPDKGELICFDNLEAKVIKNSTSKMIVELHNPTQMDAATRVVVENKQDRDKALEENYLLNAKTYNVKSGQTIKINFKK